jgi:putative transposase
MQRYNTYYGIYYSMTLMATTREERGKEIAEKDGQIRRLDATHYAVKSQSGNGVYEVVLTEIGWKCTCPDFIKRGVKCKHQWAVEFSAAIRKQVEQIRIAPLSSNADSCILCGSENITKDGIRHNSYGDIQVFYCKDCRQHFTLNVGFAHMKSDPKDITSAMQLYFSGLSFRNVTKALKLRGVSVSHVTVYKWIVKYTALMEKYIRKIQPQVSDTWRADEIFLKIKGDLKYLFALMDDETRYWIAQEVAGTKYRHDAASLFRAGKEIAGKKPNVIITDGLHSYKEAYRKEFYTNTNPKTTHINAIKLWGDTNNNKMERMNGEIRDREKVMRGLKKGDTKVLHGYQIYHNFIREHEGLDGKTPAEACGIIVEGENRWMTLIQNAAAAK